jgi:tetratricopeptide (TPR) repeat protein
VRASAIARLRGPPGPAAVEVLARALDDRDPVVRWAAVATLGRADPGLRARLLARMAGDPARLVRIETARVLAGTPASGPDLERADAEFLAEQRFNADRPEAQMARGNFAAARGDADGALAAYRAALRLDPGFVEAAVNAADVHRARGEEGLAEQVLREALDRRPDAAAARHALGLVLVRQRRLPEAVSELGRAAALDPGNARYAYVHAVALFDSGRRPEALRAIDAALARHRFDRDLLFVAAAFRADSGDLAGARAQALRLQEAYPGDREARQLGEELDARWRARER